MGDFNKFEYQNEYNKQQYDRITTMAPKGSKERWKQFAQSHGMSVSSLIVEAVEEKIESENQNPKPD